MPQPRADAPRILPLGDTALLIEVGDRIAPEVNRRARAIADALIAEPLAGVVDVVPAFATVGVHFVPERVPGADGQAFERLCERLTPYLARADADVTQTPRVVDLPICYGGEHGPDLAEVAATLGLAPDEVATRHAASEHFVYMVGFAPGHPYIGGLDRSLVLPRRRTPRVLLPRGTVAIAIGMTAIYPFDSPGGWNAIGRTPSALFFADRDPPCLLAPGDRVRFLPIDAERFHELEAQAT